MEISRATLLDLLTSKQWKAREALDRFTYNFYLRDILKPRLEDSKPQRINVGKLCVSRAELGKLVEHIEVSDWGETMFHWVKNVTIPNLTTLKFIHEWFSNGIELLTYNQFSKQTDLCCKYFDDNLEEYVQRIQSDRVCPFTFNDVFSYGISLNSKVLGSSNKAGDDDRRLKIVAILVGLLIENGRASAGELSLYSAEFKLTRLLRSKRLEKKNNLELKSEILRLKSFRASSAPQFTTRNFVGNWKVFLTLSTAIFLALIAYTYRSSFRLASSDVILPASSISTVGLPRPFSDTSALLYANFWDSHEGILHTKEYFLREDFCEWMEGLESLATLEGKLYYMDSIVRVNPFSPRAFGERASIKFEMNSYDEALKDIQIGISLKPYIVWEYYIKKSFFLGTKGQKWESLVCLDSTIMFLPKEIADSTRAECYLLRALARDNLSFLDSAIADYNRSLQLYPDKPIAYYKLGRVNLENSEFESSIGNFQTLLKAYHEGRPLDDVNLEDIYAYVGLAFYQVARYTKETTKNRDAHINYSIMYCDSALKLNPQNIMASNTKKNANDLYKGLVPFMDPLKLRKSRDTLGVD